MSMHSDQINPDSHDNDENQSPNLIDQFLVPPVSRYLPTSVAALLQLLGVQMWVNPH